MAAKKKAGGGRKYGKAASKKVEGAMHELKKGKLKSGSGGKVKSKKQAIAIGLSEARRSGAKVPKKRGAAKKSTAKKSGAGAKKSGAARKGGAARKSGSAKKTGGARKSAAKKSRAKKTAR